MHLTAKERIVLHLGDFAKYADQVEVAPSVTQEGIARAVEIRGSHFRQYMDPLVKEGLVRERSAHVKGHRQRLKAYDLTDLGRRAAARLKEKVREEPVRVRDGQGAREAKIGDLLRGAPGTVLLSELVRAAMHGEVVDLAAPASHGTTGFIERLGEAPRTETFVGRREELDALSRAGTSPRVFVVRGVAGIGKSSLAAEACGRLRGSRNLYWHRVRPWDTRPSILAGLSEFLGALGRPGLKAVLGRGDGAQADQVLADDLPGTRSFLVFDDAHEASAEVLSFFQFLKEVVASSQDVQVLLLTRKALPVYDRRDVAVSGVVREMDLGGLSSSEIIELLTADPDGPKLLPLAERLRGHPLFLKLLRGAGPPSVNKGSLRDVHRFIEEEIYGRLSESERRLMKIASLYEIPVPREAFFIDAQLSYDVLLSLQDRALLQRIGDNAFAAHDTIRDFFASILTPAERTALVPVALTQLAGLSSEAERGRDFLGSLSSLTNALHLEPAKEKTAELWEAVGDTNERIGNLPAALIAYAEVCRRAEDPETLARCHRKRAAALIMRGDIDAATSVIDSGFQVLGDRASGERAWFYLLESRIASWREDWEEAREQGEAALTFFRGSPDLPSRAQAELELAAVETYAPKGSTREAERYLNAALDDARTMGDRELEARVRVALANLNANRVGDVERAREQWAIVESLKESIDDPHIRRTVLMIRGWFTLYQEADYPGAQILFTQASALARRIYDPASLAFAQYGLANTIYYEGDLRTARDALEGFAREADAQEAYGYAMEARWMVAECCLRLEERDRFLRVAAEFRDPKHSAGVSARPVHAKVIAALESLVRGDSLACERAFDEALRVIDSYHGSPDVTFVGFVPFFRGIALRALGKEEQAKECLQDAQDALQRFGLRARLSMVREAEPKLTAFLRTAYLAPKPSGPL